MKLAVFGLSLSSAWGNGHATTYRALLRAFAERGHDVLFIERDVPWYAAERDLPEPAFCRLGLYRELAELERWAPDIAVADAVIVGSYVPDGIAVGDWVLERARGVVGFYDIDTPVTLAALARGEETYLAVRQIPHYDLYLSFTGGPTLDRLRTQYGSPMPRALYCSVDADQYRALDVPIRWDLSYLGTYSADRQPTLDMLLIQTARRAPDKRFVVAGPQYPADIAWPDNVERFSHVGPADHAEFYSCSRLTLNVTRADMVAAGYSPSVRLFEAGACGTAIISDWWDGLDTIFAAGEVLIARDTDAVLAALALDTPERDRLAAAAHQCITASHTARHRARELDDALTAAARSERRRASA